MVSAAGNSFKAQSLDCLTFECLCLNLCAPQLSPKPMIPKMFEGVQVFPALLHGDLWSGNVAECPDSPIVFDPCCFYGHSEFELAISMMFGGFNSSFYSAYHKKLPKAPGFEKRYQLYQVFNYLNHWNHFGGEYRHASLRAMEKLLK